MSWLRATICRGFSCKYSIARNACSVPLTPRQRRPGHKPCLPRMKCRAVSMSMVSMTAYYKDLWPDIKDAPEPETDALTDRLGLAFTATACTEEARGLA